MWNFSSMCIGGLVVVFTHLHSQILAKQTKFQAFLDFVVDLLTVYTGFQAKTVGYNAICNTLFVLH